MLFTTTTAYAEVTIDDVKDTLNGAKQTVEDAKETLMTVTDIIADTFTDIKNSDWFAEAVKKMSESGIIKGYPDGTFKPQKAVTYGEFIKLVVVAKTGPYIGNSPTGHWAERYYNTGIKLGLFTGADIKKTDLDEGIPREFMALMIANIFKGIKIDNYDLIQESIIDLQESKYYQHEIIKAYGLGILTGYPDGTYKPDGTLTRAESTTVINRILNEDQRQIPDLTEEKEQANKEAYWQDDKEYDALVKWIEENQRPKGLQSGEVYEKDYRVALNSFDFKLQDGKIVVIDASTDTYKEWTASNENYENIYEHIYNTFKMYKDYAEENELYISIGGNESLSRITIALQEKPSSTQHLFYFSFADTLTPHKYVTPYVTYHIGRYYTEKDIEKYGVEELRDNRKLIGDETLIEINRDIFKYLYGEEIGSKIMDYAMLKYNTMMENSLKGLSPKLENEKTDIDGVNIYHNDDLANVNLLYIDMP